MCGLCLACANDVFILLCRIFIFHINCIDVSKKEKLVPEVGVARSLTRFNLGICHGCLPNV